MTIENPRHRLVADGHRLDHVEALLERYPDTSADERDEIGIFLKEASPLEVGLLSSNAAAWTKAEQYKIDHPERFRTSTRTWAMLIGIGLAAAATLVLIWDVAAH
ncbi:MULTISPECIES: hypothetical protein [Sphingomonas]|uniref:hypothetical protein n=1 Tax=Sphingomonas TaxID=13687 RepID=UPI000DEF4178|nr:MULTISPECIES: hypothetical protein [Sphingomonas]